MNDVDHALSQIADIHAQLAASTRFRGIAPELNVLTGTLSLITATAQSIWPHILAPDTFTYIAVWAGVMLISSSLSFFEAFSRAHRLHGRMANVMLRSASRAILPFSLAGIIITWMICTFSLESAWMLPGLWHFLIGLAGFSAMASLPPAIIWAAVWYFICGAVVLGIGGWSQTLSPWMMGIPFAVGQFAVALILYRAGTESGNRRI